MAEEAENSTLLAADLEQFEAAKKEPDFLKKTISLFQLQEHIADDRDADQQRIAERAAAEIKAAPKKKGWRKFASFVTDLGPALGGLAVLGGIVALIAVPAVPVVLAYGAVFIGIPTVMALVLREEQKENKVKKRLEGQSDEQFQVLDQGIKSELNALEQNLFSQSPEVRKQFNDAFNRAATREDARKTKELEQKLEETQAAAKSADEAATLATIIAATSVLKR